VTFQNTPLAFITGFPTLSLFLDALTTIHDFREVRLHGIYHLGWWEFDCYVGLAGLGWLVYFCGLIRLREDRGICRSEYRELDFPNLLFMLLCFERVYALVPALAIPWLGAQRMATRFIVVPLTLCVILAARRTHQFLTREQPTLAAKVLLLMGLVVLAWNLCDHAAAWRIYDADIYFLSETVRGDEMARVVVPPTNDPGICGYVRAVWVSTLVSLLVFLFLARRLYLSSRRA
jgi:hypothetical protein